MEGVSFQKASNSLRRNSSVWRKDSGMEIFSRSSREEDDEEALKWAALEKLPTFDRLRKGILTASHGMNEIDIQKLGFQDTKKLLERLIKVGDDEHEKLLWKLKNRIDRVGIDLPTIEVRFDHLKVEAEVHVGGRALPTLVNFFSNFADKLLNSLHLVPNRKKKFTILNDVSGIVKPGRMALLLGPPSSGKTTLLLALAGKLDHELKETGRVTYNSHGMNEFVPQRTAAYIGQNDVHIGEMTVRETLLTLLVSKALVRVMVSFNLFLVSICDVVY
ncbi:ABC transporter G family member 40 [Cardamine amara subsp. amara]|uniref:ABC transporter G family member 40 n=1 Tax=Cardamine amara subsp. amara TaxID=228776 RepID=A0ABD1AJS4_CARAN